MPNSSNVTPRSASVDSSGRCSTPIALSANPATRNPTNGGSLIAAAATPQTRVTMRYVATVTRRF
jgi:hypothetical protein